MNLTANPLCSPLRLLGWNLPPGSALLLLCFASATFAIAQTNGIVTGRVSNAATGSYLESATVSVEGTSLQTATSRGGDFSLQVPPGKHTLVVAYTGLDSDRQTVDVAAGAVVMANFALTSGIYKLDAITVSGLREGSGQRHGSRRRLHWRHRAGRQDRERRGGRHQADRWGTGAGSAVRCGGGGWFHILYLSVH